MPRSRCVLLLLKATVRADGATQRIAALLDTSASVLAAAAAGDRVQVLAATDTFMTSALVRARARALTASRLTPLCTVHRMCTARCAPPSRGIRSRSR